MLRCLFGHNAVDLQPEKVGQFAFMYEQCQRCRKVRCTIMGIGGMSTKKWESEESYLENKRKQKEMDDRMAESTRQLEEWARKSEERLKKLGIDTSSWKNIQLNIDEFGKACGNDLTREIRRREI